MPNIAAILKEEIRRLSRKEIRKSTATLKNKVTALSKVIVRQRKHVAVLQKEVAKLQKMILADRPAPIRAMPDVVKKARIGPRSIKAQRKRLKLTQAQYAKLIGVSSPTILAWEQGKAAPRKDKLATLIGIRKITPAEARQRLGPPPVKRKIRKKKARKKK